MHHTVIKCSHVSEEFIVSIFRDIELFLMNAEILVVKENMSIRDVGVSTYC